MDCYIFFPHSFSILFFYFSKLYLSIFFNIELIENLVLYFFSLKHYWLLQSYILYQLWIVAVFFHMIFFMIFSTIICPFFFNIKLVKNYNYNKAKSYGKSVVVFLTKHYGLLQSFSKWFFILFYWGKHCSFPHKTLSIATTFFLMGFFSSKIIFVGFFLMLSW